MPGLLPSLFFLVLGIGFIVISLITARRARATVKWPVAPATILSSEVHERHQYDSDRPSGRTTYEPVVKYQYTVLGTLHDGSRVSFGDKKTSRKKAREIVGFYPAGMQLNARYNPEKVEEAVLETSARGITGNIILGILFIAIAVAVFFLL